MKIFTLNTWQEKGPWQKRWEIIFDFVSQAKPDLIGFQEVFNPDWVSQIIRRTGYAHAFWPEPSSGLLTLSTHPFKSCHSICYDTASPTEPYRRFSTSVQIAHTAKPLFFFNTHLTWLPEEFETRTGQILELNKFVHDTAQSEEAVCVGDFNAAPDSLEIRKWIQYCQWTDSYAEKHPDHTGCTWDNQNAFAASASHYLPDRRIDYIFFRNRRYLLSTIKTCDIVLDNRIDGIYASDHYGLIAEF